MSEQKAKSGQLFSILSNEPDSMEQAPLRGIARLAAEGSAAGEGHLIEFRTLPVKSLLNSSVSRRGLWFAKSINPYRGCEFGCKYCYARYTHEFMEMKDPEAFERRIFIKENAAWLLQQELRSLPEGMEVALGTATDPYQPVERHARITRSILEVFSKKSGIRLGIVTKSTLIERDIDLLQLIARSNELVIHMTITTSDAKLARILEPRAPRPDVRFRTVRRLREAGLVAGVMCSPLMPGITDNAKALDTLARKAKAVDASFFVANPLFLKPCSKGTFLSFVHEHFPELDASYAKRYEERAFVTTAYQKRIRDLVHAVIRKHGLNRRFSHALLTYDGGEHVAESLASSGVNSGNNIAAAPVQAEFWPTAALPPSRGPQPIRPHRVEPRRSIFSNG
jgi:DNA repair photolyase